MSGRADGHGLPRSGSLRELPFERLLFALFREERTVALHLRRLQIKKTLWIDGGAPVECLSNLRHETLGQFLLNRGRITSAEFKDCLSESAAREVRMGEVLLERGLLAPDELTEALRQNLAYKLLECFTWVDGEFRIEPWLPEREDAPAIHAARVVFTGITKFVPQDRVTAAMGPLLERPLALAEPTRFALRDLRLSPRQAEILRRLRGPVDAHALFQEEDAERDALARTLYAGSVMGMVVAAEALPARPHEEGEPEAEAQAEEEEEVAIDVEVWELEDDETPWALRDEIAEEYRKLADGSPLELFGLPAGAPPASVRARYVELCRRYAPDRFESVELSPVADMAAELLHAATTAYERFRRGRPSRERVRADSAAPEPPVAEDAEPEASPDPVRMAGDYVRQARQRMASGNFGAAAGLLTLALRSDPGNPSCRVQLAYARFRESPERASESLAELEEVLEGRPDDASAHLFAAEICHALEDFDGAVRHFEAGTALWERAAA